MKRKDCEKCIFDEKKCVLCTFVSDKGIYGKQKKLKFYSVEFHELQQQKMKDLHLDI